MCVAVVASPGTVNVMHCLEVLGDSAGVHVTPADSVLSVSPFRETELGRMGLYLARGIWKLGSRYQPVMPRIMAEARALGVLVLSRWSRKSSIWEERRPSRRRSRHRMMWSQVCCGPSNWGKRSGFMRCRIRPTGSQPLEFFWIRNCEVTFRF